MTDNPSVHASTSAVNSTSGWVHKGVTQRYFKDKPNNQCNLPSVHLFRLAFIHQKDTSFLIFHDRSIVSSNPLLHAATSPVDSTLHQWLHAQVGYLSETVTAFTFIVSIYQPKESPTSSLDPHEPQHMAGIPENQCLTNICVFTAKGAIRSWFVIIFMSAIMA